MSKLTKEMLEAPKFWTGFIDDKVYNIHVSSEAENDPKSYFNSHEGIKIRYRSKKMMDAYDNGKLNEFIETYGKS